MYIKPLTFYAVIALKDNDPLPQQSTEGLTYVETALEENDALFNYGAAALHSLCLCSGIDFSDPRTHFRKSQELAQGIAYLAQQHGLPRVLSVVKDIDPTILPSVPESQDGRFRLKRFFRDCSKKLLKNNQQRVLFDLTFPLTEFNTGVIMRFATIYSEAHTFMFRRGDGSDFLSNRENEASSTLAAHLRYNNKGLENLFSDDWRIPDSVKQAFPAGYLEYESWKASAARIEQALWPGPFNLDREWGVLEGSVAPQKVRGSERDKQAIVKKS